MRALLGAQGDPPRLRGGEGFTERGIGCVFSSFIVTDHVTLSTLSIDLCEAAPFWMMRIKFWYLSVRSHSAGSDVDCVH